MTRISYEIRSLRNTPIHAYDNEHRAREAWREAQKRVKGLRLFKIIKTEEEITK